MSHFTTIKTQIKDAAALIKALADVGFKVVENHETAQPLYGYQGDIRPEAAEIIIRRKYISGSSNDIGFQRQSDGSFQAIISEFDRRRYAQDWLNQVTQRYGYHLIKSTAPTEGFTVEEEQVLEDGTIRLVVGRWV